MNANSAALLLGRFLVAARPAFIVTAFVAAVLALFAARRAFFRGFHFFVWGLCAHGKGGAGQCDQCEFQDCFHSVCVVFGLVPRFRC